MSLAKLSLFTLAVSALAGCRGSAEDQAMVRRAVAETRADVLRIARQGHLNDGIPTPTMNLDQVPLPTSEMGKANRKEIDRARFAMLTPMPGTSMSESAQKILTSTMRDPESVIFRAVTTKSYMGKPYVCGEFNARNGFGGYVGYSPFLYASPTAIFLNNDRTSGYFTSLQLANYAEAPQQIAHNAAIAFFCP